MINKIELINQTNNLKLSFLDSGTWRSKYGVTCRPKDYKIATEFGDYKLHANMSGFHGLSNNNNMFLAGIDQDGSDFQSNYYSNRILSFDFQNFKGENYNLLNSVLKQDDDLLEMRIYGSSGLIFKTYVTSFNNMEEGIAEFESPFTYFSSGEIIESFSIEPATGKFFFPFNTNSIYFEGQGQTKKTIATTTKIEPLIKIESTAYFTDPIIENAQTGSILVIKGSYLKVEVDCLNALVYGDGVLLEQEVNGTYPFILPPKNDLIFSFASKSESINVSIKYEKRYFNVY